ncbi:hypothetical protein QX204_03245 [Nocardia sp. PE-7]|uniref:hypothetical protein n=1 Tax=Nocardia sp. PE-7 TaxID=3058426 RepID=UPI002658E1C7|nr:hypothetical protein [Nocardia sp. PE-7]WKG10531.1 hypothetical protein QX204_03245 [Nocardia sp. PE-7]
MGTEGDDNERGDQRPAAEFGPPVSGFGPPVDDAGFGGPVPAAPPPAPSGVPERGWRPAGPPTGTPAPGPFGPPAGAPAPGPFGGPVAGQPPVTPPPGPPGAPFTGSVPPTPSAGQAPPRLPDGRRSAPTSVFGDAVATPPPTPPAGPGPRSTAPFGGPTPGGPPAADPTVRFGGEQPRGESSVFGDSVFGDSVPVTSGRELTEVIRRGRPGPKDSVPQAPSRDLGPASEPVRPPEGSRTPLVPDKPRPAADKAWWDNPDDDGAIPKPPSEPGLSWADDPIARRLAPKNPITPAPVEEEPDNKRLRWIIGGVAAAVLLVVALVLTIGLVKRGGGADPGVTAAPIPSIASASECQTVAEQSVTVGNGPGDTTAGARAILGFQYAFYTDRSGAKVRDYVAPDAENISPAETIQQAIDSQIPPGTTHCVKMRETTLGRYDVELREMHPDGSAVVYKQEIITTNTDGKWQVKSITAR